MKIPFKTYTLYAVDRVTGEYLFVLSVNANNLKSARQFAQKGAFQLNRKYPKHHYDFRWEQDK